MPSPLDQLSGALAELTRLVEDVHDDQWEAPTPCGDWTVSDLVHHVEVGQLLFAAALRGEEFAPPSGEALMVDRVHRFRASSDDLEKAFAVEGALERTVTVPFGEVPGTVALHLRLVEALVHGWDLARATGQRADFDEVVVEQEFAATEQLLEQLPPDRSPFGPPQPAPDGAPVLDRLAARLGRTV